MCSRNINAINKKYLYSLFSCINFQDADFLYRRYKDIEINSYADYDAIFSEEILDTYNKLSLNTQNKINEVIEYYLNKYYSSDDSGKDQVEEVFEGAICDISYFKIMYPLAPIFERLFFILTGSYFEAKSFIEQEEVCESINDFYY